MFYDSFLSLCTKKGVKPSRVAIEAGFNKGSVSVWKKKYEFGIDVQPTLEILNKIADYFGVSVDYLLGRNNDEMQFGLFDTKLKRARLDKGLTQKELAEKLGVTQTDIDKWESGNAQIDDENLKKCAELFKCQTADLIGYAESKLFPNENSGIKKSSPPIDDDDKNVIVTRGRDGSYTRKQVTDEQLRAIKLIIDQLPDADF